MTREIHASLYGRAMKLSPLRVAPIVALTIVAAPIHTSLAEWVWEPAQMLTAEELATSGALAPVAIPTKLSNFRYPFLQEDGSVIFIANDHLKPANEDGRAGIFKIEANDRVTTLTSAGEGIVNSAGKVDSIMGLKVTGGRAVFRVNLDNGDYGIALWENGRTVMLASAHGREGLDDFGYPDISEDIVVFSAKPKDAARSLYAIDLRSAERRPVAVVPHGTPIPGSDGLTFQMFADSQFADGKNVVFRAYSGMPQTFHGTIPTGSGVFRKLAFGQDAPVKVIDTSTPVPGAAEGQTFDHYIATAIPRNGYTAFTSGTRDRQGIYLAAPDGKIGLIADTNTAIPDLFEGTFTRFNKWVSNCDPWIVFVGEADKYLGLFVLNRESQVLYLLADSRVNFDGKTITGAEVSNCAKIGDRVALMLEFDNGTSGVYIATFGKGLSLKKSAAAAER